MDSRSSSGERPARRGSSRRVVSRLVLLPRLVALALVRLYQLVLSPWLPPACRFEPSCSAYAAEALRRFGLVRGGWLALGRLLRCHPWGGSGFDPVPSPHDRRTGAMHKLSGFLAAAAFALSFAASRPVLAQPCGEQEPGRVEWQYGEEGQGLYRVVFTAREATVACFELLHPQYEQPKAAALPAGVPSWVGAVGPLNLVSTWDTEYLPFALSWLALEAGELRVRRTVKGPVAAAVAEGWKVGEVKEVGPALAYRMDPVYSLVSSTDDEALYVWPDPAVDESPVFIEKRYRRLGGFRIGLWLTVYNFSGTDLATQPQLQVHAWERSQEKGGIFSPPPNVMEGLCMVGERDLEREVGADLAKEAVNPGGEAAWAGVGNRYFLLAAIPRGLSDGRCSLAGAANGVVSAAIYRSNPFTVSPPTGSACHPAWHRPGETLLRCDEVAKALGVETTDLFTPAVQNRAFAQHKDSLAADLAAEVPAVLRNLAAARGAVQYRWELFLGPKDIDRLKEAAVGMEESIDFWIVGIIAKPMLYLLRWFYALVPHWAFAIIMLTILVKLALLYWTQKSFVQMQRMGQLKPMMEELKEKYGKDKERLNQEMMNLYKREKVNPLGGCLPMLLQMPIWIALYRTIYSSVELYQAPLGLWITDMSAPDPYFVLPIILGASMFVQQKLTPTTMDSAQAKMMLYMMPLMFTVFMLFLPSGLNLYILVNTFLTLAQQWYLRKKLPQPKAAKV